MFLFYFFFQAEDGIRDYKVTGVQTCALPISAVDAGGMAPDQCASTVGPASLQVWVGTCGVAASTNAVSVRVSISHPPYGVRRCTTLTTKAPLSGRARARVSGKRNRASGSVVYPEFHTTNTSSPITGIQWNRTLKSTRSLSLSYWTNASRLVRALKSYSNRLADNTAVNAPTGRSALVRVRSVLTMIWPPPRHAAVSSKSVL